MFLDGHVFEADLPMPSGDGSSVLTGATEDAHDDEITRVLDAEAFGQNHATEDGSGSGLCSFELQSLVYPHAGTVRGTNKTAKHLPEQKAGTQARTQQTTPASQSTPRELCCCAVASLSLNSHNPKLR